MTYNQNMKDLYDCIDLKVDGIITDYPKKVQSVLYETE